MPPVLLFLLLILTLLNLSISDDNAPTLQFKFLDDKRVYTAGDTATIQIVQVKGFKTDEERLSFKPKITFNSTLGDSSYVTGLTIDMHNWKITFLPIKAGWIYVEITDDRYHIMERTLDYNCTPAAVYELGGVVSWMGDMHNFVAGETATVWMYPKDTYGNNVTSIKGMNLWGFVVAASKNGTRVQLLHISYKKGWNPLGYFSIEFEIQTAGNLLVDIKNEDMSLAGAPLPLTVHPEALVVENCLPQWRVETKSFQLFSTMEVFVHTRDKYGNLVPGMHEFDFEVMRKGTNLSSPVSELRHNKEVSPGIQSFSFKLLEPGDFALTISKKANKMLILNMPFEYNVYIGYCDDSQSILFGPGLNDSVAGEESKFYVLLKDAYQYPSPLNVERLQVQITLPSLSLRLNAKIDPKDSFNGTQPTRKLNNRAFGLTSDESATMKSSEFDVIYVPEKSGIYEILIFCGNVPLNGGNPFRKVVSTAKVDLSKSKVISYEKKVSAGTINGDIIVQLLDFFSNPVSSKAKNLTMKITEKGNPRTPDVRPLPFDDNNDGTYRGWNMIYNPGDYLIEVKYENNNVPSPFDVNVFPSLMWPVARNDTYTLWEDQSIAFNVLENDQLSSERAVITGFQKPRHGSLLQYGVSLFRYTPYKGFAGNDGFTYTMQNEAEISASGGVKIYVVPNPPQFISYPKQLQATENIPSPKSGGYPSIELKYSDPLENITVKLSADHGTVFLSPLSMLPWDPMGKGLSVNEIEGKPEYLKLTGRLEMINLALESLKYIGEEDFSGTDTIRLSAISVNGTRNLEIPIFVEAINEPPFINVPNFIMLDNGTQDKGFLIFDKERDNFNFSVGDPDQLHFSGNETDFLVMFSVEVSSGLFSAKLPSELKSTTELKLNNSKQWQPLQSFAEISSYFTVKARGIRFRGTINHCNGLLEQLLYYGDRHDEDLRIRINDLGWYGCYLDCTNKISVPLTSEATIKLITGTPMSSVVAHSLGSVIVAESLLFTGFALILMFFTCKCVIVLRHEKKDREIQSQNVPFIESNTTSPDNMTEVASDLSSP